MRQGIFNFPGVATNPIYDPSTTRRNADGTWARDPFPGNQVPLNRIDPVARKVLDLDPWVLPNQPGSFTNTGPSNNVLANEYARTFFNDYNLRLDHQFSPAFKIYGSLTENDQSGFGRPKLIKEDLLAFDAVEGNYSPFRQLNTSVGYTWVISQSVVNDSRAGYFRRRNDTSVPSLGGDWPSKLGIPNVDNSLMPSFGIYNITGATPSKTMNETLSCRNDTTWVEAQHAFKFGYEILRFRLNSANFARFSSFAFDGVTSGLQPNGAAIPNTGITFAGFPDGVRAAGDIQRGDHQLAAALDDPQLLYSGRLEDHAAADGEHRIALLQREPLQYQVRHDEQLRPERQGRSDGRARARSSTRRAGFRRATTTTSIRGSACRGTRCRSGCSAAASACTRWISSSRNRAGSSTSMWPPRPNRPTRAIRRRSTRSARFRRR